MSGGYTLLLAVSSSAINATLYSNLSFTRCQGWATVTCPELNLEGESLDELYDKLFHGIEELTGEPKVEFELVVLGRRWPALV
jgi:hypothetical protein